jgi:hypothetical protein
MSVTQSVPNSPPVLRARLPNREINELLDLAGVKTPNPRAEHWIADAVAGAQGIANGNGQSPPAEQNASIDSVKREAGRLISALEKLEQHSHADSRFRSRFKNVEILKSTLAQVRSAADTARIRKIGRPRNLRKQQIVNFALAFCARFSKVYPSSDQGNFFPSFAERFFELSTGSSTEIRGNGIDRQIRVALKRLPMEKERAALLHKKSAAQNPCE